MANLVEQLEKAAPAFKEVADDTDRIVDNMTRAMALVGGTRVISPESISVMRSLIVAVNSLNGLKVGGGSADVSVPPQEIFQPIVDAINGLRRDVKAQPGGIVPVSGTPTTQPTLGFTPGIYFRTS